MALTWMAIRDQVSYRVYGKQYSDLKTAEAAIVDAEGPHALDRVTELAQWFSHSTPPDSWEHFFVAEASMLACQHGRPDRYEMFRNARDEAMEMAINTLARSALSNNASAAHTESIAGIRLFVLSKLARGKNRIFVDPSDVDDATKWVLNNVWYRHEWNFRRRRVKITIGTDMTVSIQQYNLSTNALESLDQGLDAIATRKLFYDDGCELKWVSADAASSLISTRLNDTGRPEYFRMERRGEGSFKWHFIPAPAAQYECYGEVFIKCPSLSAESPFSSFPACFRPALADLVLAKVMLDHDIPGAGSLWDRSMAEIDNRLPLFEDHGAPDDEVAVDDVYRDIEGLSGDNNALGGHL